MTIALQVEHLSLAIGGAVVVDDIGFAVAEGEVMAIVGESGCGKSITAQAIMRLLPPAIRRTGGSIRLGRDDITAISDPERRIYQHPFELSGGMCQRVLIAAALIARPTILIADEPTTALDVTIQAQILDLLRRLAIERQTAVVLITHDMGVVADIADRVAVMYAGRIAESGPTQAIFAAPRHPYTALLLASIPRLSDIPKSQLATIEGRVPTPAEHGAGCRFANRCPRADARCTS